MKTLIAVSVTALMLLGCGSSPKTIGDLADERGSAYKNIAKDYEDGEKLIKKGNKQVKSGKKQVKSGNKDIKDGNAKIRKGQKLINRATEGFKEKAAQ